MADDRTTSYFDQLAQTWDQNPMKIERSRATAKECKKLITANSGNLLDIGGGTGLLSIFLRDHFSSITIADMSSEMLKVSRKKIAAAGITNIKTCLVRQDISEIPGHYSAIITLMTLHHIEDLDSFFRSAAKLLQDRGRLMIADLYQDADGSFHHKLPDFRGHHGFSVNELEQRLKQAGFQVTETKPYYQILKQNRAGEQQSFPLFFMTASKTI
jgi:ubiquinone/menaquinone biosynthesis C-methylase UbiE